MVIASGSAASQNIKIFQKHLKYFKMFQVISKIKYFKIFHKFVKVLKNYCPQTKGIASGSAA